MHATQLKHNTPLLNSMGFACSGGMDIMVQLRSAESLKDLRDGTKHSGSLVQQAQSQITVDLRLQLDLNVKVQVES